MRFFFLFLFLLSCSKENNEQPTATINDLTITTTYKQIDGVDPNLLSLDIYYNSDTNHKKPVVIYIHGGGWALGDKANQIENKVALFKSLNYVFISINYRLSPYPFELDNPNRLVFPTHNNDVAAAIKWVYDTIDQYGGNPNKIGLIGHSAGAHLAALTGTNSDFLENVGLNLSHIKGIAAIDTQGYNVLDKVQENNNVYRNAFGTNTDLNTQASPTLVIENGRSYPKFLIAKRGSSERIAIADDFINALGQNGVSVSQIEASIYDHNGINNAIGAPEETLVTNAIIDFFSACFN